jgi:L-ascorbate metabolism protein UlaG (beta-lactamase superfamily)
MIYQTIDLRWLGHSGVLIKSPLGNVYIDPFKLSVEEDIYGKATNSELADIIFITHSHYDHCSIEDIRKIVKDNTIIICPADVSSKFSKIDKKVDIKIANPGTKMEFFSGKLKFWAVPAYNTNKSFHSRDEDWVGYVIQVNDTIVYHAGDTDIIPEMKTLASMKIDFAFLPIGGTFTMNAGEAAKAAGIIKPKLAIPMHYGSISNTGDRSEAEVFQKYCSQEGIEVKIL